MGVQKQKADRIPLLCQYLCGLSVEWQVGLLVGRLEKSELVAEENKRQGQQVEQDSQVAPNTQL